MLRGGSFAAPWLFRVPTKRTASGDQSESGMFSVVLLGTRHYPLIRSDLAATVRAARSISTILDYFKASLPSEGLRHELSIETASRWPGFIRANCGCAHNDVRPHRAG